MCSSDLSAKQTKMLKADFGYFFPTEHWHVIFSLCAGYMDTLKGWLGDHFDGSKLLWRGSRDGLDVMTFHRRCDNKGATLTVIKSMEGWIFGGYNPIDWKTPEDSRSSSWGSSTSKYSDCSNSFVFTLKNPNGTPPTQYFCHKQANAVYNNADCGPSFGSGDLTVWRYRESSSIDFPSSYTDTTGFKNATFTGRSSFKVAEIEVFSI